MISIVFVEDYMTAQPQTASPDDLVTVAAKRMRRAGIRHLPVLDESRRLVGIVTDRDIRSADGFEAQAAAGLTVGEIMTADPVTLGLSATLDEALRAFATRRVGAIPIVEGGRLVGILSRSDLLRTFHHLLGLDEEGRTIEVALPGGFDDLRHAFDALANCREAVISAVVSKMRRDGGEPALYLRVAPDQFTQIERRLREAALILLAPEHS